MGLIATATLEDIGLSIQVYQANESLGTVTLNVGRGFYEVTFSGATSDAVFRVEFEEDRRATVIVATSGGTRQLSSGPPRPGSSAEALAGVNYGSST